MFLMIHRGRTGQRDKLLTAPNRYKKAHPNQAHSHHAEKKPGETMRTR